MVYSDSLLSFAQNDEQGERPLTRNEARQLESQGIQSDKAILPTPAVLQRSAHAATNALPLVRPLLQALQKTALHQ
jgi:hypothetical protein